jgi:diguanylate cyclase (GGDEF)-like protein
MASPFILSPAVRTWAREHADVFVAALSPIERRLAGRAGGALFVVGGASVALYPLLPGSPKHGSMWILEAIAAIAISWGACALLLIRWERTGAWLMHAGTIAALASIALIVAVTGGSRSMAWLYLFWVAQYCCYFYERPIAMGYVVACIGVQALPVLYDLHSSGYAYRRGLVVAALGYLAVGSLVATGKRTLDRVRVRAETLASEQEALRRAATAVMRGEPAEDVFELICVEIAKLSNSALSAVHQILDDGTIGCVASWSNGGVVAFERGESIPGPPTGAAQRAIETRAVVRRNTVTEDSVASRRGCRSSLLAPVIVEGEPWGLIALCALHEHAYSRADEQRIEAFCEMLAQIVTSLEERAQLAAAAMTDKLTGLPNDRALHERLASELASASRRGKPLAVVMIDLDTFKEINDRHGHAAGDSTLRFVADCMRAAVRTSDTVGRLGGDEFMWILPDCDSGHAAMTVARARKLIAQGRQDVELTTTSAGICDTASTSDPAELVRLADVALYASKASGRNQVTMYESATTKSLDLEAREAWFERSQALAGLRALARAIDARDPATDEHAAKVSELVGRLTVPEALLTKRGVITEAERAQMDEHFELSARIVGTILEALHETGSAGVNPEVSLAGVTDDPDAR